jgi:hypothetical protein
MFSISGARYRPHRLHPHQCAGLQDFLAVDTTLRYRPRRRLYRPQLVDIARASTVKDLLGLQGSYSLRGPRGRCGRYLDVLYGYISLVQANEACCRVISRR